ncbi:DUF29 domain-containing protein [Gigaspora margarita]|uniref:DUF29 domain-containing protein n=1 Tax=Gigaspora margarita TaxID=4874 RepID=A0A8H3WR41_GIGMA|nr:DUF29 domain-containing protein [Gigaspora margarita]
MDTSYEKDVVAWASEQAALLRAGKLTAIDVEHIAEEIEDVGRSEKRELANRMAVLLVHLLKWKFQPERRGSSWQRTIKEQRNAIALHLEETPSLKAFLSNPKWRAATWADTVTKAINETGLDQFPNVCPWDMDQVLSAEFYPD